MTTASPEIASRRAHRGRDRDAAANTDTPTPTGANSRVSESAMTARAHDTAAAVQSAQSAIDSLQKTVNAATRPAGQARTGSTGDGARQQTGQPGTARGKDSGPRSV
jgi:hypothetical protein